MGWSEGVNGRQKEVSFGWRFLLKGLETTALSRKWKIDDNSMEGNVVEAEDDFLAVLLQA